MRRMDLEELDPETTCASCHHALSFHEYPDEYGLLMSVPMTCMGQVDDDDRCHCGGFTVTPQEPGSTVEQLESELKAAEAKEGEQASTDRPSHPRSP